MERSDVEEKNAKCNICSHGLSSIEAGLYGNRCYFHSTSEGPFPPSMGVHIIRSALDLLIHREQRRLGARLDGQMLFLGALAVLGYVDINQVLTARAKYALIRELKKL
jgi:hypothetical protein